jgi:hypothetical protein
MRRLFLRVVAAPVLVAGVVALPAAGPAAGASVCTQWREVTVPSPGTDAGLAGVAALSATSAWAVGSYHNPQQRTLILRWGGSAWQQVASPNPGSTADWLEGVAVRSASDAWAVGVQEPGSKPQTLIVHWNGKKWQQVPSPDPAGASHQNWLYAVTAVSASNAWAVGKYFQGGGYHTLVLHWNGSAWRQITSSAAKKAGLLDGVAASATQMWAVGVDNGDGPVIVRHNGSTWAHANAPAGVSGAYGAVAVTSQKDAWAVGLDDPSGESLTARWNGSSWQQVASPSPGADLNDLNGVTTTSASNAWAVGSSLDTIGPTRSLVLHWNGTNWQQAATPSPGSVFNILKAVTATSPSNAWAVGVTAGPAPASTTLMLRCQ